MTSRAAPSAFEHLFRFDFDRDSQVRMCAGLLYALMNQMGDAWWDWIPITYGKWTKEQTDVASWLIRHSSESRDYIRTVDFITKRVRDAIESSLRDGLSRTRARLIRSKFHHEHMMRGTCVLKLITRRTNVRDEHDLYELLDRTNYRALLQKRLSKADVTEESRINAGPLKSTVPAPNNRLIVGWCGPEALDQVPVEYHGLLRYDAAGLLSDLIPLSDRARVLLNAYSNFKARRILVDHGKSAL